MSKYELYVGNIGNVWDGDDSKEATHLFDQYSYRSKLGIGRAGGEAVILFEDGDIKQEHEPREETMTNVTYISLEPHDVTNEHDDVTGACIEIKQVGDTVKVTAYCGDKKVAEKHLALIEESSDERY